MLGVLVRDGGGHEEDPAVSAAVSAAVRLEQALPGPAARRQVLGALHWHRRARPQDAGMAAGCQIAERKRF